MKETDLKTKNDEKHIAERMYSTRLKVTAGGTETVVERKNIALIREYADFSGIGTKEDEDQNEQGTV